MHLLFFCPSSRATWFISKFQMRVDSLPLDFTTALIQVGGQMTNEQKRRAANLMWCIWKARNMEIFEGGKVNPIIVNRQALTMTMECSMSIKRVEKIRHQILVQVGHGMIHVDGSWDPSNKPGAAILVYDSEGKLRRVKCMAMMCQDLFKAEAKGVQMAIQ
jgi:hypothetical protein